MNITEIKETIDILSFLSSKWKKRTIIAAIELLFFFQYVYCVFFKCINLSNCGIEIIYNISYLKNISILYIVLSFVVFFIWFFSVRIKKINKKNIGIVFAIETENLKQKKRLSSSFYDQVVNIIRESTDREIEILQLDEYYSRRLRKDKNFSKKLINKIRANIILYGRLEERRNNAKDLYSIDFNAIVRHKALPQELSQIISQEMCYVLPKNINFEIDNEFSSFTITSEIIGESVKFILGLSFAYSGLYDEAYKMHNDCLDISFSKIKSGKNNLLSQRMYQLSLSYAISELKQLAQISRIEGRLSESIEYINRALILNPEDYGALLEKSICCFLVGNIQESMNVLIKCSIFLNASNSAIISGSLFLSKRLTTTARTKQTINAGRISYTPKIGATVAGILCQATTVTPPPIKPAIAPFAVAPFQKRANKTSGPNVAPKPAQA